MVEENKTGTEAAPNDVPGSVITPGAAPPDTTELPPNPPDPVPEPQAPTPAPPEPPTPDLKPVEPTNEEEGNDSFYNGEYQDSDVGEAHMQEDITWIGPEFLQHDKSTVWYVQISVSAVILAAILYLATRSFVSVAVVVVSAIIIEVYGSHRPKDVEYKLRQEGISIGSKFYHYDDLKSFSVVPEARNLSSIMFVPLKRFSPISGLYYDQADEARIVDYLSSKMPLEERRTDMIDRLLIRIRF